MDKITAILRYLHDHHMGANKAILSRNLERYFELDGRSLRRKITSLREEGYPICSGPKGYYFAASEEEFISYLCWRHNITSPHNPILAEDYWEDEDDELFGIDPESAPCSNAPVINFVFCFGPCHGG